jgi:hypothetical protein
MSYLRHAVAVASFAAVTTAAPAQTVADIVGHTPKDPVKDMILLGATERIGTTTPFVTTRQGDVFTTKIYDGPLAGQTLVLDTKTDTLSVSVAKGAQGTLTSDHKLVAYPDNVRGPIFSSTGYNTKSGDLSAECTVEKNSVALKGGTRDASPENIRYEFTCKTALGNGFLQIAPATSYGTYYYRIGLAIEADPKTGATELRMLNRIAEFSYK